MELGLGFSIEFGLGFSIELGFGLGLGLVWKMQFILFYNFRVIKHGKCNLYNPGYKSMENATYNLLCMGCIVGLYFKV